MIKSILILFLLLGTNHLFSQEFEGIVSYKLQLGDIDQVADSLLEAPTEVQKDYYKGSYYKSLTSLSENGPKMVSQFDPETNLTYAYIESKDPTAYWYDASKWVPTDFSVTPVADQYVLGYRCKGLRFKSDQIEVIYWFSESFKIDPKRYENNDSYYFSEFTKLSGSLPIKYAVKVGENEYNILTAVDIEEKILEDKLFHLPKFKRLVESKN